jgi:hypothetical protein
MKCFIDCWVSHFGSQESSVQIKQLEIISSYSRRFPNRDAACSAPYSFDPASRIPNRLSFSLRVVAFTASIWEAFFWFQPDFSRAARMMAFS